MSVSLLDWVEALGRQAAIDEIERNKERYRKAGKQAMKIMRKNAYAPYKLAQYADTMDVITSSVYYNMNQGRARLTFRSYAEPERVSFPLADRWMDDHSARFGLARKWSSGEYVVGQLAGLQGIVGLPPYSSWQNEPGLKPATPADKAYLIKWRQDPWFNPHFLQISPLNEYINSPEITSLFEPLVLSNL